MKIKFAKIALQLGVFFSLESFYSSCYGATIDSTSMNCPNGNIVRFEKGQIFTSARVFSNNGHLLADVHDIEWVGAPTRHTSFCTKFPKNHNLIFAFYGLGGSSGGIQIVGIDTTRKKASVLIKKTFSPFLYDKSKTEWLGVGVGFYVYRGQLIWDNKDREINLLVKRINKCNVDENANNSVIGKALHKCLRSVEKSTNIVGKIY